MHVYVRLHRMAVNMLVNKIDVRRYTPCTVMIGRNQFRFHFQNSDMSVDVNTIVGNQFIFHFQNSDMVVEVK